MGINMKYLLLLVSSLSAGYADAQIDASIYRQQSGTQFSPAEAFARGLRIRQKRENHEALMRQYKLQEELLKQQIRQNRREFESTQDVELKNKR